MGGVVREQYTGRRLLVLGGGPGQLGLLETARALGLWTAVCDRDPAAPGFALADRRCLVATDDEPAIARLAAALRPDGIVAPGSDRPVAVAARVAEKLGLDHPLPAATALLATSRVRQREALDAAGVPQPRWQIAHSPRDLELAPPFVVMPADRTGRAGLAVVRRRSRLVAALDTARAACKGGAALVEELVDGPEVTVSGFSAGGEFAAVAVCDRLTAAVPVFGVALAQIWPSPHAEAAAEVARRAVEALGIRHGPTFTKLRVSRGGPEVIEVGARLGGGYDAELAGLVTGLDLNALAIAAALGEQLSARDLVAPGGVPAGGAVVRFLAAPPGRLQTVEAPQGLSGVVSTRLYREPGHLFGRFRRASDRAGALLVAGATRAEALARAEAAAERIRFVTADDPAAGGARQAAAAADARTRHS